MDPQVKTPDGKYYDVLFIGTGTEHKIAKFAEAIRPAGITTALQQLFYLTEFFPLFSIPAQLWPKIRQRQSDQSRADREQPAGGD